MSRDCEGDRISDYNVAKDRFDVTRYWHEVVPQIPLK